jgi:xanthine dehydrogenase iron-sulfur cluster and FAD-binding subunit A
VKSNYDFSKAEKGKFYRSNIKMNIPVYLDDKSFAFVNGIAKKRKEDISSIVNHIIKSDIQLIDAMK